MTRRQRTRAAPPGGAAGTADARAARRASVLATLYFAPAATATLRELVRDMERVHSTAVSAERMRCDLAWLAQAGLVRLAEDTAQITERGRDVARRAAPWPAQTRHEPPEPPEPPEPSDPPGHPPDHAAEPPRKEPTP